MAIGVDVHVLIGISQAIRGDHKKLPILAHELGIPTSDGDSYISTNQKGSSVTTNGTLEMLKDWKERHVKAEQGPDLKRALIKAGFAEIADDFLEEHCVPEGSLKQSGPSRSAGTSTVSAAASKRTAKAQKEVKVKREKASPRPAEAKKRKSTDDGGNSGKSGRQQPGKATSTKKGTTKSSGANEQKKPKTGTSTKANEKSSAKPSGAGSSGKSGRQQPGKATSSGAKEQKKPKAGTSTKAKETSSTKPRQGKAKPSTAKKGGK